MSVALIYFHFWVVKFILMQNSQSLKLWPYLRKDLHDLDVCKQSIIIFDSLHWLNCSQMASADLKLKTFSLLLVLNKMLWSFKAQKMGQFYVCEKGPVTIVFSQRHLCIQPITLIEKPLTISKLVGQMAFIFVWCVNFKLSF